MAAALSWFDSDGVTPLLSLDLGILAPGEDYITKNGAARHVKLENSGDVDLAAVTVELQQVGAYDAWTKAEIATGAAPAYPADYVDSTTDPLSVGALAKTVQADLWVQVTEPLTATPEAAASFNLVAVGSV